MYDITVPFTSDSSFGGYNPSTYNFITSGSGKLQIYGVGSQEELVFNGGDGNPDNELKVNTDYNVEINVIARNSTTGGNMFYIGDSGILLFGSVSGLNVGINNFTLNSGSSTRWYFKGGGAGSLGIEINYIRITEVPKKRKVLINAKPIVRRLVI